MSYINTFWQSVSELAWLMNEVKLGEADDIAGLKRDLAFMVIDGEFSDSDLSIADIDLSGLQTMH